MLLRKYHEKKQTVRHRIDYGGAVLLTIGLTSLILGMLEGGNAWAWISVQSAVCFGVGVIALAAFGFVERRVAEPIVDLRLAEGVDRRGTVVLCDVRDRPPPTLRGMRS